MENSTEKFDFNKFIEDSKAALLNPEEYFSGMPHIGGFVEPVIKVIIYGVIIGILNSIWFFTGFGFAGGPSWLGGGVGIMTFIGAVIFSVIGLFVGGVIMLIISSLLGGNSDYEANVRVVASLMVVQVVGAALGFFDGINLYLGAIVAIAVSLWGLYMTYYALTVSLKAGEKGARILLIVLAVLSAITTFSGIAAKKAMASLADEYGIEDLLKEDEANTQDADHPATEEMDEQAGQESNEMAALDNEENENTTTDAEYIKPEELPEDLLSNLADVLSDQSSLDEFSMNRTMMLFDDIQDLDKNLSDIEKATMLDSLARKYDFENLGDAMTRTVQPALFSATILTMAARADKQPGTETMMKAILSQNTLSKEDLEFTYYNWDKVMLLNKQVQSLDE